MKSINADFKTPSSNSNLKYSIILPVRNGSQYLEHSLKPLVAQTRSDFEVVIVINDTNGISPYLLNLTREDNRFKTFVNEEVLQMSLNYEKALSLASGEWILLLGADDSILEWFFNFSDAVIKKFPEHRLLRWRRAHYFWENARSRYGYQVLNFAASQNIKIVNSKVPFFKSVLGLSSMFNMPQIYTCSLVHSDLISRIREDGAGRIYQSIIPDIYSSLILMQKTNTFVDIDTPLTLVGTSGSSMNLDLRIYREKELASKEQLTLNLHGSVPEKIHSLEIESLYLIECMRQSPYQYGGVSELMLKNRVLYDLLRVRKKYNLKFVDIYRTSQIELLGLLASPLWLLLFFLTIRIGNYINSLSYYLRYKFSERRGKIFYESRDCEKFDTIEKASNVLKDNFSVKIANWLNNF
jgi:glycosyltransferase involved in cell wall biosynthesis